MLRELRVPMKAGMVVEGMFGTTKPSCCVLLDRVVMLVLALELERRN
jgi:hypothetical protein